MKDEQSDPLGEAFDIGCRAAAHGFDWRDLNGPFAKVEEELAELRAALAAGEGQERLISELGDLLFSVVNVARKMGLDPSEALAGTNRKFQSRWRWMLKESGGLDGLSLSEMEALWQRAKDQEP